MTTSAVRFASVRAAFDGLIDYAGLFPPARLEMPEAVAEYEAVRSGAFGWMVGRFIIPASRLGELRAVRDTAEPFALSVILDGAGMAERPAGLSEAAMRPEVLEIPAAAMQFARVRAELARTGLAQLPVFAEWPRGEAWERELAQNMAALAACGWGAKVRCGGLEASAFPPPGALAAFIAAAHDAGVRYKATAGLHHPVRHFNPSTGAMMNGFLNLLFAAVFARAGASRDRLEAIVACEDAAQFRFDGRGIAWGELSADTAAIAATRRDGFVSYGSCSVAEPVSDLQSLGLL